MNFYDEQEPWERTYTPSWFSLIVLGLIAFVPWAVGVYTMIRWLF